MKHVLLQSVLNQRERLSHGYNVMIVISGIILNAVDSPSD